MGKIKPGFDHHSSNIKSFKNENSMIRIHSKLYRKPQRNSVIGGIYFPRKKSKDVSKEKYKEASRLKVNYYSSNIIWLVIALLKKIGGPEHFYMNFRIGRKLGIQFIS